MRTWLNRDFFKLFLLLLLLSCLVTFYWYTVMYLPLFGDAATHAANAKDLLKKGWENTSFDYPALYSYLMIVLYTIFGEKGFNLVPFLGLILLFLSTFLFIRELTKSYYLGLISILFVACSPKIILYSAKMYQEILISSFIIFSLYLLFNFLRTKRKPMIFFLAFFIGISLSFKQQALFILFPSIFFFFVFQLLIKKIKIREFLIFLITPILVGLPFYGVLFHTTGVFQPGSEEFGLFRTINIIGQKVFFYKDRTMNDTKEVNPEGQNEFNSLPNIDTSNLNNANLELKLEEVGDKYAEQAYKRAEDRHIWPWEVFTNFDKFNQANSLYLDWQGRKLESSFLFYVSFIGLIGGVIYLIINYKKNADFLAFSLIFVSINYILFMRNNDQQRYHVFLPIFLLVYIFAFINFISLKIFNFNKLFLPIVVTISLLSFMPIITPRIIMNRAWENTQGYAPSEGGIESVKEAGNWIKANTSEYTIIGQQCGPETRYYSERTVIGDWRIYFIDIDSLKKYFSEQNIPYYVMYKSQVYDDNQWSHLCWVPKSFQERLESNFKKVFTSHSGDIFIYKVL
jgi:hypothetical protein